ncbi:hypothetical protein [Streptomyces griseoviridis]|uniref:hypothetical protein n=1 Tax=Streptomyces griseoviridis TaxID=45398 RepID=UPI0034528263
MTAARYEVVQTDAQTGGVVTTLPVASITYTETLNAAGSASVSIPLTAPEADPTTLYPGASGFAILRDGEPVWGGLLWTAAADLSTGVLTLNASGYHSYYAGRVLHDGYNRKADQAHLLRDWYELCNAENGIATDTSRLTTTGRIRSRTWTQYELKNIAEAVQELAEDAGGFNFRYVPYWTDNGRIGNRVLKADQGENVIPFALVHRENCNVTQVSYDSAAMATRVYAVGADNGNGTKLVGIADNEDLAARMPTKHMVQTFSDVKTTETLLDKSAAIRDAGREPVAIPSLTLYPGAFSPTDFVPGDSGAVQADYGYVALLSDFVITERKTDVDVNGTESTSLSLANKELFTSAD